MSNMVRCPHCTNEFPLDQVMSAQLEATIRDELEAKYSQKIQALAGEREKISQIRRQLEARQEQLDEQVRKAVSKERESIAKKAKIVAQQAVALEIKDRDSQLQEAGKKLEAFETKELELLRKKRELEEQSRQQDLKVERWRNEEGKRIRESALKEAKDQHALKQAEKDHVIDSMRKKIDELQCKADQGSQQTQGEVQEIALENLLAAEFPGDEISPVAKGAKGGDVIQHVFDHSGRDCGSILWESKRTKNWSDKWLSKTIDDQQEAKASCACIVTTALPETIQNFGDINGVWVANWQCARGAALALRSMLIEASRARVAAEGQHGKAELVYQYVFGPEFRNRVRGLVEPCLEMQDDLEAEKRAFNRHWNKRQKQLDRALGSTTGLFGDLQGIIGNGLQEIEGMDLLALEKTNETEDATPDAAG